MSNFDQSAPASPLIEPPVKNVLLRPDAVMRRRIDVACGLRSKSPPKLVLDILDRELPSIEQIEEMQGVLAGEEGTR